MADFVGAVDQGTTSTRFMIFDHGGNEVARHQLEHEQILPQAGWVEHNPVEIWERTSSVHPDRARRRPTCSAADLAALGITNQRETTVVWNRKHRPARTTTRSSGRTPAPTGSPRRWSATAAATSSAARPGLPPATYFSGGKIQWILENVDGVREAAERGDALFGNTDTLAAVEPHRRRRRRRRTSPTSTNASRTMLMDLETLDWDDELLGVLRHPARDAAGDPAVLATRTATARRCADGPLGGEVPLTGDLGDQQAATVGQVCFAPGEAKNTYGTGNFMLLNTGTELVRSKHGLLTTVVLPVRRRARRSTRWRARSRSPARPCSGCATSSASSRGAPRVETLARQVDGQRRRLLRARVLRPVRAVLALRRPRRDRRAVPLQHQRAPGPGHAGGDLLPEPRRRRGDGAGLRGRRSTCSRSTAASPPTSCACRSRPTSSASR